MVNRIFIFRLVDDLNLTVLDFTDFGKEFIKSQKVSPDSFVQLAIQLAFYRMHGVPGATYESASTRVYQEGRTEGKTDHIYVKDQCN